MSPPTAGAWWAQMDQVPRNPESCRPFCCPCRAWCSVGPRVSGLCSEVSSRPHWQPGLLEGRACSQGTYKSSTTPLNPSSLRPLSRDTHHTVCHTGPKVLSSLSGRDLRRVWHSWPGQGQPGRHPEAGTGHSALRDLLGCFPDIRAGSENPSAGGFEPTGVAGGHLEREGGGLRGHRSDALSTEL